MDCMYDLLPPFLQLFSVPQLLPNPLWQILSVLYPHPPALCQFSSYNPPLFFSSQELAVNTHGSFLKVGLWLLEQALSEHRETLKNPFYPQDQVGTPNQWQLWTEVLKLLLSWPWPGQLRSGTYTVHRVLWDWTKVTFCRALPLCLPFFLSQSHFRNPLAVCIYFLGLP